MDEFDYKEYARQMRENVAKDENGIVRVSPELWEQIASIIEDIGTPRAFIQSLQFSMVLRILNNKGFKYAIRKESEYGTQ